METGIFDFYKLMEIGNKKQMPEIIHYRSSRNFGNNNFCSDLKKEFLKFDITNPPLSKFNNDTVLFVLDKQSPKRIKSIRSKNFNFMTK